MVEALVPALLPDTATALAVALGAGLLIGLERERHKGRGDDREAAGLRTFAVAAVSGALAQSLAVPGLVAIGALLVALLTAIAYGLSRSRDPGLTTELALMATYLIGVQAPISPPLAAACGAGLALLLAARARLHRLATELLTEQELHDGLLLAALALIVLPLVPAEPIDALADLRLRPLVALVLLILAMQAAGQMALRALGPRAGLLAAGFLGGFVSSTATVASFGSRARAAPTQTAPFAGAAVLSAAATWVQALAMTTALSPRAAVALLPVALAGALGNATFGAAMVLRRSARLPAGPASPDAPAETARRSALRPREAIAVATMLAAVAAAVGLLQRGFGDTAMQIGVALAALADAHAPIASLAALHAAGALSSPALVVGTVLAIAANTLTRCIVAAVAGGRGYAWRVALPLVGSLAAAAALAAALR